MAEGQPRSLEERTAALEQNWTYLKMSGGILSAAVLLATGYGFIEIPRKAVAEAVTQVKPIAEKAATDEVVRVVPERVKVELENQKDRAKKAADAAERDAATINEVRSQLEAHRTALTRIVPVKEGKLENKAGQVVLEASGKGGIFFLTVQAENDPRRVQSRLLIVFNRPHHDPKVAANRGLDVTFLDEALDAGSGKLPLEFEHSFDITAVGDNAGVYQIKVNINWRDRPSPPMVKYTLRGLAE